MKHIKHMTTASIALLLLVFSACQQAEPLLSQEVQDVVEHNQPIEGHYIVIFKDNVLPELKQKFAMNYDQKIAYTAEKLYQIQEEILGKRVEIKHPYFMGFVGFAAELTNEEFALLKEDARVERIESDKFVALAPPPGKGKDKEGNGGGTPDPQVLPWGVDDVNGGVYPGDGKIAWILDTGIDQDHPDLNVNTSLTKSFVRRGNGDDKHGHGTHVAGTVAALDNNQGVIGVAAGASVVAVQVLDQRGSGTISGVIAGVQYVGTSADNDDVANMSLGGGISQALDDAVVAAANTCIFVLAAGNENTDALSKSPARSGYNNSRIHTVSAYSDPLTLAGFSNYGVAVDYGQPGVGIYSCYKDAGYTTMSGTSMAAPHMAGLVLIGFTTDASRTISAASDKDNTHELCPYHN